MKTTHARLVCLLLTIFLVNSPAFGQSFETLQDELQTLIDRAASQGIRMSAGVKDLSSDAPHVELLLGSQASFPPASTIKLLLIAALMQKVDRGIMTLDTQVAIEADDVVGGMGILQTESVPQQVTLRRLAELTVTISDNTATNVLVDVVGYDAMAALADQLGLRTMQFGRKMFEAAQPPIKDNVITAGDALILLDQLYRGTFLSPASTQQVLDWMSAQTVKSKIGAGIPAGVPVAHKTGENGPVSHDIGYLLIPGHEVAMVFFAETSTTTDFAMAQMQLNPLVAELAQAVYRAVQP
ncbi:MAG: serine hydrolase [Pseudohongiella sp.]|nr:serine hydrolase [Pseudohongiella sp.]